MILFSFFDIPETFSALIFNLFACQYNNKVNELYYKYEIHNFDDIGSFFDINNLTDIFEVYAIIILKFNLFSFYYYNWVSFKFRFFFITIWTLRLEDLEQIYDFRIASVKEQNSSVEQQRRDYKFAYMNGHILLTWEDA